MQLSSYKTILVLFLLLPISCSFAQVNSPGNFNNKTTRQLQEAEQALLSLDGKKAETIYLKLLKNKSKDPVLKRGLAAAYKLQNRNKEAGVLLEQIIQERPNFSRIIYAELAQLYFRQGEYDKALDFFNQFDAIAKRPLSDFGINAEKEFGLEASYRQQLQSNISVCRLARDKVFVTHIKMINHLGLTINTDADEYFPFLTNDQSTLYFTRKKKRQDENLLLSHLKDGDWMSPIAVDTVFNTTENEGMATFTKDHRQLFFTACERPNVTGLCDIQRINIQDGQFQTINLLEGSVNTAYWESQACISCDGRTLFFASNRPGGFGSTDIYESHLMKDGRWSSPKNLGPEINTDKDEEAPFITNDGKILFFASTGHLGFGEQDIFMTQLQDDGTWGPVVNLGATINTAYRELGVFLTADGKTGFLSSDRPGGNGGMDIYQFDLSQPIAQNAITYVEGYVKDSVTNLPIQVTINSKNTGSILTDKEGRFFLCLESTKDFNFTISHENYERYSATEKIPAWKNKIFFPINILLKPIMPKKEELTKIEAVVEISKQYQTEIFFDFDVSKLNTSSINKLEALINRMGNNKISKIEIQGFSDQQGPARYNLILSENRAKSVADFFKSQSIFLSQNTDLEIIIIGKGETTDRSTDQLNRRVEVKIFWLTK